MQIRKQITNKLMSLCQAESYGEDDVLVVEEKFDYKGFQLLIASARKSRTKKFHVTDIIQIHDESIPVIRHEIIGADKKHKHLKVNEMTGCFKVCFSDGTAMYYAKWYSGEGKLEAITGLFAARESVWVNFVSMNKRVQRKIIKPPVKGCYRLQYDNDKEQLYYVKQTVLQENRIFGPARQKVEDDMHFFFSNLDLFTRFNMSGIRKALFIGEPGTGKSSFCSQLARHYGRSCLVVFATEIYEVIQHINKTSYYNMRSVVIFEDADSSLYKASSRVLNFLDGVDSPVTKNGTYLILTTNYPQKIEPRILKRPGRIDKIFHFGPLNGEDAFDCAKHYFEHLLNFEQISQNGGVMELKKTFNGLTGAQIKELSYATVSYSVGQNLENITIETIRFVKNEMMESIKEVNNLAKESSISSKKSVGFELSM